jgi:hypothetical protein
MKRLRRSKDRKKSTIKRKLEKDLWRFVEDNKTEAWTLLEKRENYILLQMEAWILLNKKRKLYIAKDNKDADGSMDSIRRR